MKTIKRIFLLAVIILMAFSSWENNIVLAEDNYSIETEDTYTRIYGKDRYQTSIALADVYMEYTGVGKLKNVIVASGTDFADALGGSYLSYVKDAPILISKATSQKTDNKIIDYIEMNLSSKGTVYILGGEVAVSEYMETQLIQKGISVKRLAGKNRYLTNIAILQEAGVSNEEIIVATGKDFADSLSASACKRPILLVNKTLSKDQIAFLNTLSTKQYYIVGGTSAVSADLESQLKGFGNVTRVAGDNRYATSVEIANTFFSNPRYAVVALATNFPDGLCGGALATILDSPIILTKSGKSSKRACEYTDLQGIHEGYVLGGATLIDDETAENIFRKKGTDPGDFDFSGTAYAVLQDNGDLVFFRSNNTYKNEANTTVKDIKGNTFKGIVFADIESQSSDSNNWHSSSYSGKVLSIYVAPGQGVKFKNAYGLFSNLQNVRSVNTTGFDTKEVTSFSYMFSDCVSLERVDASGIDTSNAKYLEGMFSYCHSLKQLDLSNFYTGNALEMNSMFYYCNVLNELDISNFDTSNVTNMNLMFNGCKNLIKVTLGKKFTVWKDDARLPEGDWENGELIKTNRELYDEYPANHIKMAGTWRRSLAYAVLTDDEELVFFRSYNPYDNMSEGQAEDINGNKYYGIIYTGFEYDGEYFSSRWIDNEWKDFSWKANGNDISRIYVAEGNVIHPNNIRSWFSGLTYLDEFDARGFDVASVTEFNGCFSDIPYLEKLDLSSWDTSNAKKMNSMFNECTSLTDLNLSSFDTSNVTDMSYMFSDCSSLSKLDLSNFVTGNVTDMGSMFNGCSSLTELDISNFNTSKVTSLSFMFMGCKSMKSLDLSHFNTAYVTTMGSLFSECYDLESVDLSSFNTARVTNMAEMFYDCRSLVTVDLSGFNTSKVTSMEQMFHDCRSLTSLDLSSFDTGRVTDMARMFYYCSKLEKLNLSGFDTSKVTDMYYMFSDTALNEIKLGSKFTKWTNNTYLPSGKWSDGKQLLTEKELCEQYPQHAEEWAGTWYRETEWIPEFTWTWNEEDGTYSASALFTGKLSGMTSQAEATVTKSEKQPTCETDGELRYTASATGPDGKIYKDEKITVYPAIGHDYDEPTYSWTWNSSEGQYSVYAQAKCRNNSYHTVSERVMTVSEIIQTATCEEDGVITYTAEFENELFIAQTRDETIPSIGHSYKLEKWDWNDDYSEAKAVFVCENDSSHREEVTATISKRVTQEETCTEEGIIVYKASVYFEGNNYYDEQTVTISPSGHEYHVYSWDWSEDYSSADAWIYCSKCDDVWVKVAAEVERTEEPATCEEDGYIYAKATAVYAENEFTDKKTMTINKLGHDYQLDKWNWVLDFGNVTASADFECLNCHEKLNLPAKVTASGTQEPDCTHSADWTYNASVDLNGENYTDERVVHYDALGHEYEAVEWYWYEDYSEAIVILECKRCYDSPGETLATVTVTRVEPTCDEDGKIIYTATAEYEGQTFTDVKEKVIPATGHDYYVDEWIWAEDYSEAEARLICSKCNEEEVVKATIAIEHVEESCDVDGAYIYTASVDYDGKHFEDSRSTVIPAYGHSYGDPSYYWSVNGSSYRCQGQVTCQTCGNVVSEYATVSRTVLYEPTCTDSGLYSYTAAFKNALFETQYREVTADPLGHYYRSANWAWADDYATVDVTLQCTRCDHEEILTCDTTARTTASTCTKNGSTVYSVSFYYNNQYFSNSTTVSIPATGHSYAFTGFTWTKNSDETYSAKANYRCTVDNVTATVSDVMVDSEITLEPTFFETGVRQYSATVSSDKSLDGQEHTDTYDVTVPMKVSYAYATLTSEGNLVFYRSGEVIAESADMSVTDVMNNVHTGKVFVGIETSESVPWTGYESSIREVFVESSQEIVPLTMAEWFKDCVNLISFDPTGLKTDGVNDMSDMFRNCSSLVSIDLSRMSTEALTDINGMFAGTSSLTEWNLSNFNTSKVTDMSELFREGASVPVLSFDVSSVYNMRSMFENNKTASLNLENFNTSSVTDFTDMFKGCTELTSIKLGSNLKGISSSAGLPFENWSEGTRLLTGSELLTGYQTNSDEWNGYWYHDTAYAFVSINWEETDDAVSAVATYTGNNSGYEYSMTISNITSETYQEPTYLEYGINRYTATVSAADSMDGIEHIGIYDTNIDKLPSLAYAIFNKDTLTFFRSTNEYEAGANKTVTDLAGNTYKGTLYANFEDVESFNSSSEVPWYRVEQSIKYIKVAENQEIRPKSMAYWFYMFVNAETIDAAGFDTRDVTSLKYTFYEFGFLSQGTPELDLSSWDTRNVTNMDCTFYFARRSKIIDVSNFNTSKVTNMGGTFGNAYLVQNLDVNKWDTSNVTTMSNMFLGLSRIKSLDVSHFDTANVTHLGGMFEGCSSLTELDVSHFDTSNVLYFSSMFRNASSLKTLDISNFNTQNATNLSEMFSGMSSLESITLGKQFTVWTNAEIPAGVWVKGSLKKTAQQLTEGYSANIDAWSGTWTKDTSYTYLGMEWVEKTNGYNAIATFKSNGTGLTCTQKFSVVKEEKQATYFEDGYLTYTATLTAKNSLDKQEHVEKKETVYPRLESYAYAILKSDGDLVFIRSTIENATSPVVDVFENVYTGTVYKNFEDLTSSSNKWSSNVAKIKRAYVAEGQKIWPKSTASWFSGATALTSFDPTGFDMSRNTSMASMFYNCTALTSIDLTGLDTSNVTSMSTLFSGCTKLTSVNVKGLDVSSVTTMASMFASCSSLTSLDLGTMNSTSLTTIGSMFNGAKALTSLKVTGLNTSKVTTMTSAFRSCTALTSLDLSTWKTDNVTKMDYMFYGSGLKTLNLSKFNTTNVTSYSYMFQNASSLETLNISSFDNTSISSMYSMFAGCTSLKSVTLGSKFTPWKNNAYFPTGTWKKGTLSYSETELYALYPLHASEYAGTWTKS